LRYCAEDDRTAVVTARRDYRDEAIAAERRRPRRHEEEPEMSDPQSGRPQEPGNQVGKRYRCNACGTEILCLHAGEGEFTCHDEPMEVIRLRPLPASD
jgi:desulfoferrodoxin-like iron-binding protein